LFLFSTNTHNTFLLNDFYLFQYKKESVVVRTSNVKN